MRSKKLFFKLFMWTQLGVLGPQPNCVRKLTKCQMVCPNVPIYRLQCVNDFELTMTTRHNAACLDIWLDKQKPTHKWFMIDLSTAMSLIMTKRCMSCWGPTTGLKWLSPCVFYCVPLGICCELIGCIGSVHIVTVSKAACTRRALLQWCSRLLEHYNISTS